jgi:DNA repair exonuclease SbcCD ATPase subunit
MSRWSLQPDPEWQRLADAVAAQREFVLRLLEERHALHVVTKPWLLALYRQKLGAWEVKRLTLQAEVARLKRRMALAQAALNHGQRPDWDEIEGRLDLEFLGWKQRVAKAVGAYEAAQKWVANVLTTEDAVELKQLWRQMVKRLHPDVNGSLSGEAAHLWARAKSAYERADLDEMRLLFTLLDEAAPESPEGPDTLKELELELPSLRDQAAKLHKQLTDLKQQPPFSLEKSLLDDDWVAARRQSLESEISDLEKRRDEWQAALDPFTKPKLHARPGPN